MQGAAPAQLSPPLQPIRPLAPQRKTHFPVVLSEVRSHLRRSSWTTPGNPWTTQTFLDDLGRLQGNLDDSDELGRLKATLGRLKVTLGRLQGVAGANIDQGGGGAAVRLGTSSLTHL
jgi:hypothetical protein